MFHADYDDDRDIMEREDEDFDESDSQMSDADNKPEEAGREQQPAKPEKKKEKGNGSDVYLPQTELAVHKALQSSGKHNATPSQEELIRIAEDYRSGDADRKADACEEMLCIMDAYIVYMARKRYPTYWNKYGDELIQQGYLAVYSALADYDPKLGTPTTYFHRYIDHSMQEFINTQIHHSTPYYTNKLKKIDAVCKQMIKDGCEPTLEKICIQTGLSTKTVQTAMAIRNTSEASLSAYDPELNDTAFASQRKTPEQVAEESENTRQLYEKIMDPTILSTEEQICITMAYALYDQKRYTAAEIAAWSEELFGVPIQKHQVQGFIQNALRKLRASFKADMEEAPKQPSAKPLATGHLASAKDACDAMNEAEQLDKNGFINI